ncbi:MAG: SCO family protein [Deltaproteobacteria bacterium]|nr:SCO family protein [Deltaproteobacteria bacterium]
MRWRSVASAVLAAGLFGGGSAIPGLALDAHRHGADAKGPAVAAPGAPKEKVPRRLDENEQLRYFTDTKLLDQEGREVRFYTDAMKGKIVLFSFIYTNCTDVCPILMHNLTDVSEALGDRFGKEVFFVSISVDPEDDTPEELRRYAERYRARPGWTFLTGPKKDVDAVIRKFGEFKEDFEDHSMMFVLGDVKNARWSKVRGDLPPGAVIPRILNLLDQRESGAAAR